MKKLYGLLAAFFFLCTGSVVAQNIDVAGKVTDPDGAPVAGATIRVEGTKSGLQTQMDGSFKASVKEGTKLTTDLPITDISFISGFSSLDYFSTAFAKKYKLSPKKFRTLKQPELQQ